MSTKAHVKNILCNILEWQVRRLRRQNPFKVVAVVGSVGKTSTKLAIAHSLELSKRVIYQDGNYNDRLTVPLVLFGRTLPGLTDFAAWIKVLLANERILRSDFPYDVAILELGTDGPGQIGKFAYLQPDLAVITAITPEHMEFFATMEAVAAEELAVADFTSVVLANADDIPREYLTGKSYKTYGVSPESDYRIEDINPDGLTGVSLQLKIDEAKVEFRSPMLGLAGAKITAAAAAVAHELGLPAEITQDSLQMLPPVAGRMQILKGLNGSAIIDDTYNASPVAVKAGLDVLAAAPAGKRIAILGSMNELGDYAQEAHEEVGDYCNPNILDEVVTIGLQARDMLAPRAVAAGCKVTAFLSPYEAGRYLQDKMTDDTVVLAEGSQNGVFAEEAVKLLLADPADAVRLVRQSPRWSRVKARQFPPS